MNKYPLWKYLIVLIVVALGALYAIPNLFGEDPAIQISATRATKVDAGTLARVEQILGQAKLEFTGTVLDETGAKVRFADTETQIRARDLVQQELGDGYTVALNLLPATPGLLRAIGAEPMYLGLDLRGGVHFLMQVDSRAVLRKASESTADDLRRMFRESRIRYAAVNRLESGAVEAVFREAAERERARELVRKDLRDVEVAESERGSEYVLIARLSETALAEKRRFALEQNMTALRNRVNELGVAEPVIQQQGADRIVVQLPGVQDTAKAKEILGRTATLEIMLVDEEAMSSGASTVPPGSKLYRMRDGRPIVLKNRVIYSGDNIVDSAPGFDSQTSRPIVSITLDARGASINQRVTGENVGRRMAVVYIEIKSEPRLDEQGRPVLDEEGRPVRVSRRVEEVITAPVIRQQLGKRFQIEGLDSTQEANELSLLLRAGALAAPVEIIEERTVGPSLGQENIDQGVKATLLGFATVVIFMVIYYKVFGLIADLALLVNLVLLVAVLSMFQATLTLPGIAGILLTLGMAVDANVLINERIREELRNGNTPQASIHAGYEKAFSAILDGNVTTLIAAMMLFNFGTGPIKGFAVTLSIGILTTMFTAVMCARAMTNLTFGGRKLKTVPV
ncbi:preprotein translocase subunit SecD [Sulfurifustis variabilis]|uniref:Protein translocase subunit SecD n=1 Tax=Sulfurifustis variabilis TaxID=1675686 RepID=A0A1B4VAG4_9GAMM|nr:protein translocase subunit SecD [Sulfurifustis variabilis]BAU48664.1 preprotein translocase subunit SecD [Sulfurifustis variabilis]